jgi:hypothetical protein
MGWRPGIHGPLVPSIPGGGSRVVRWGWKVRRDVIAGVGEEWI